METSDAVMRRVSSVETASQFEMKVLTTVSEQHENFSATPCKVDDQNIAQLCSSPALQDSLPLIKQGTQIFKKAGDFDANV